MFCVIFQAPSYLANILAHTDGLLVSDLRYLVNTLINSNDIPKMYFCYLAIG